MINWILPPRIHSQNLEMRETTCELFLFQYQNLSHCSNSFLHLETSLTATDAGKQQLYKTLQLYYYSLYIVQKTPHNFKQHLVNKFIKFINTWSYGSWNKWRHFICKVSSYVCVCILIAVISFSLCYTVYQSCPLLSHLTCCNTALWANAVRLRFMLCFQLAMFVKVKRGLLLCWWVCMPVAASQSTAQAKICYEPAWHVNCLKMFHCKQFI